MWTERVPEVPKAAREAFACMDFRGSPMLAMTNTATAKAYFVVKAQAGEVQPEYVGHHGVGGMLWPPLEHFDEHVRALPSLC